MSISRCTPLLTLALALASATSQRMTIPDAIARGSNSSVATVPSGTIRPMRELLRGADVMVIGTVGDPVSYLSADELEIHTGYPLFNVEMVYRSSRVPPSMGIDLPVTVTLLGGSALVNGVRFTQFEPALPSLQLNIRGLFILERSGDKYFPIGKYFGAFDVSDGTVTPLVERTDFASQYRGKAVAEVVDSLTAMAV